MCSVLLSLASATPMCHRSFRCLEIWNFWFAWLVFIKSIKYQAKSLLSSRRQIFSHRGGGWRHRRGQGNFTNTAQNIVMRGSKNYSKLNKRIFSLYAAIYSASGFITTGT